MASRKDPLGVKDNDRTGVGAFEGAGVGFDEGGGLRSSSSAWSRRA